MNFRFKAPGEGDNTLELTPGTTLATFLNGRPPGLVKLNGEVIQAGHLGRFQINEGDVVEFTPKPKGGI